MEKPKNKEPKKVADNIRVKFRAAKTVVLRETITLKQPVGRARGPSPGLNPARTMWFSWD